MKAPDALSPARIALALVSLSLVLAGLVRQVDRVSPGPLSAAHGQESELVERGACARCHGATRDSMAGACMSCHTEIEVELREARGFHGTLAEADPQACASCHGEHAGEEFRLVSTRSFALAGFKTREAYDHAALDFRLQGRHAELGCAACHANADVLRLAHDEQRFGGLDQGCQKCHEDVHQGRIARACADCHGQEHPFTLVASFRHDDFTSVCGHAAPACAVCHEPGSAHDSELLAGPDPPHCARACESCHSSPHTAPFMSAVDVLANVAQGDGCEACHDEGHGTFRGHLEDMPPAIHAASGFALDAPHNDLACAACHMEGTSDAQAFGAHVPARQPNDCRVCHGDPHAGEFDSGPFAGETCLACHERERFEPSAFSVEEHARCDFPLLASHQAVACARCHESDANGALRRFADAPKACAECHADAHRGAFDDYENPEGCARCHQPTLFSEILEAGFVHGDWTDFVLDGAHARAECRVCHTPSPSADAAGRTFGFASERFGEPPTLCVTCHADVHDGRFDRAELPASVEGRSDCARCHSTEDFSTAPADFEHERWTGYPIAPFHAELECTKCHVPAPAALESGRTFGRAPLRCADCHADPHVAQFAVEGVTDCARCHQDAGGLAFDHQRDSRYPLDEVHVKLECTACHQPWPLPGGGEAVRYKPLGVECVDCHDPGFLERAERAKRDGKRRGGQR